MKAHMIQGVTASRLDSGGWFQFKAGDKRIFKPSFLMFFNSKGQCGHHSGSCLAK